MNMLTLDEQDELLSLTREADSVELKFSVAEDEHGSASLALGLDPIEAEIRQVYFFDTHDLALDAAGVVVRARRIQGGTADTVIKLRPVVPEELPKDFRRSSSMKVEVDVMPGRFVASASMKGRSDPGDVLTAVREKLAVRELFSKEQREFFKMYAPDVVRLDDLVPLGPILTLKLKFPEKALGRELVAEAWFYPDNSRILEISTKCKPDETFQVVTEARSFLLQKGIDPEGEQKTKTKAALQYYSRQSG